MSLSAGIAAFLDAAKQLREGDVIQLMAQDTGQPVGYVTVGPRQRLEDAGEANVWRIRDVATMVRVPEQRNERTNQ